MNKFEAKEIALTLVDRWQSHRNWTAQKPLKLRYVVVDNRNPPVTVQGHVFFSRLEAIKFARATYDKDYALYAMTATGSIDVTPA